MKRMITILTLFSLLALSTAPSVSAQEWRKLGVDFELDISGIVSLQNGPEKSVFLVVHDNKYPHEDRVGIVTIEGSAEPFYYPLEWPRGVMKPVDIESLSRHPDGDGFFCVTSKGVGAHLRVDDSLARVEVVETFTVPLPLESGEAPEAEGFSVVNLDGIYWACWADRGSDERTATVFWGHFDPTTYAFQVVDHAQVKVPYPTISELRHISELRVNGSGVLYISSAAEGSNDGPFAGAFYVAGVFRYNEARDGFFLHQQNPKVPLHRAPGQKIEAFDLVPGPDGGIVFATDNEHQGSSIWVNWMR